MDSKQRNIPDKINEQYILPVLFILVNITVVIWFYVIYEYNKSDKIFRELYKLNEFEIERYTGELKLQMILFSVVLLATPLYLKYRKRWLLAIITMMHMITLYYFFYV